MSTILGPAIRTIDCLDAADGIVESPGGDYFAVILQEYLSTGRASCGVVGRANSELIDAADIVGLAVAWTLEHFVDG